MSLSVVEASQPEQLVTAASNLGGKVTQLNSAIDAQRGALTRLRSSWEGRASDAAFARAEHNLRQHTRFRDQLKLTQRTLQTGGTHLSQTRSALLGVVNSLRSQGWQVSDDGVATPPPTLPAPLKGSAAAWTSIVQRLLTTFDDIDKQTAGSFPKFGGELDNDRILTVVGDEKKDEKSPAEIGAEDSEALQKGELTPGQRERLMANTTLMPEQQAALDNGTLVLAPERMSYLQGFSRAFGDKTPAEIKAIMDEAGPDGGRVADVFQLASNPTIKTRLPETQPPSITSSGGRHALPDGIQHVLDGPALTQPFTEGVSHDGRVIVPPEPTGPLQPTQGLNELADIIQRGNRDLQEGTALDSGLFEKSQEMLVQSNTWPIAQAPGPGSDPFVDGPKWYHENIDPTLQNMFNAVNKDSMVIHDALAANAPVRGPDGGLTYLMPQGKEFLDNLTKHQWQDDGLAAGGLLDWVGETANDDPSGRAAQTAHALAEYTSSNSQRLLNVVGDQSLGQVNPELTRDMSRAFAPYLDDMVGSDITGNSLFPPLDLDGDTQVPDTRALLSVVYSDEQAAQTIYGAGLHHIDKFLDAGALSAIDGSDAKNNFALQTAGRLQAALDLGAYDESMDRLQDAGRAAQDSWERRSRLFDIATTGVDEVPVVGGPISGIGEIMKSFIVGEAPVNPVEEAEQLPPRSSFPIEVELAETLLANGAGDADLPEHLRKYIGQEGNLAPPDQSDFPDDFAEFSNWVAQYLENQGLTRLVNTYEDAYKTPFIVPEKP
jgi:uncharacterized protein YukE